MISDECYLIIIKEWKTIAKELVKLFSVKCKIKGLSRYHLEFYLRQYIIMSSHIHDWVLNIYVRFLKIFTQFLKICRMVSQNRRTVSQDMCMDFQNSQFLKMCTHAHSFSKYVNGFSKLGTATAYQSMGFTRHTFSRICSYCFPKYAWIKSKWLLKTCTWLFKLCIYQSQNMHPLSMCSNSPHEKQVVCSIVSGHLKKFVITSCHYEGLISFQMYNTLTSNKPKQTNSPIA
jgi:hypothetical protein